MKKTNTTIIIPKYKPNKEIFNLLRKYLKKNAKGFEIIEVDGSGGIAKAQNIGIKKASGEIIILLHQDCIPMEKNGIKKLIEPFKNPQAVLSYGWVMEEDIKKKYYPFPPDGKFTAYKKSALHDVGYFDEKTFLAGGEDVDVWLKLKKLGKIIKVNTGLLHIHPNYRGNKTPQKKRQSASINGTLFRIWGIKNPKWFKAILMSLMHPFSYGKHFINAFLKGKQDYQITKDI
jgi:GT2 family glycosyltransferase